MSLDSHSTHIARIAAAVVFSGVAGFTWGATSVDLGQFTPDTSIINYSVYTTDSILLPPNSGLANGGLFGSGGGVVLGDGTALRAPYIGVGRNLSIGNNPIGGYI